MNHKGYDIIGDIHGHALELRALLETMGYASHKEGYQHASRKVIFLGDFIDRGPRQREVLQIVMAMVQEGHALAVMGNHEFNALGFHTEHPDKPGTWLRPRTNKNTKQHLRFLDEYLGNKDELEAVLAFFHSLPLWLDLDGLRVVHACWDENHICNLQGDNKLTAEMLIEASKRGTPSFDAVEALLKGVEQKLPEDHTIKDKDGITRDTVRTRWWINSDSSFGEIAFPIGVDVGKATNDPVSAHDLVGYPETEKPVFIGHYWLNGEPSLMAS